MITGTVNLSLGDLRRNWVAGGLYQSFAGAGPRKRRIQGTLQTTHLTIASRKSFHHLIEISLTLTRCHFRPLFPLPPGNE